MTLDDAKRIAEAVFAQTGHRELVVIGSNSILGIAPYHLPPPAMSMSSDLDAYLRHDPNRTGDLAEDLGEGSPFHVQTGTYLDVVSPGLVTAPEGWQQRMLSVPYKGLTLWFLDPVDAAVSKLARGEARDIRWVRAGLASGILSEPILRERVSRTTFLDADEAELAVLRLDDAVQANQQGLPIEGEPDLGF